MSTATFVFFRHRTDSTTGVIDLPMLSNTINKSVSYKIEKGDIITFDSLKEADQLAITRFTKKVPASLHVIDIAFEPDLEIKDGIRKIYLEG